MAACTNIKARQTHWLYFT